MAYHTNEELVAETRELAARAGSRAALREVGRTVEGRTILGVRIAAPGLSPGDGRPQALITANIHGTEVVSSEVALRLLDLLTATELDDAAREVLALADVTLVPAINLDARQLAADGLSKGRMRSRAPRANRHNIDLNRNFPFPPRVRDVWHPLAGTKIPWMPWYRGPAPLSEPETQAMATLAQELQPHAAVNLHSAGRLLVYPWACLPDATPDAPAFQAMGTAFCSAQAGCPYKVENSRSWYTVLGDFDDWLYATFRTLAVTVELDRLLAGVGGNLLNLPFTLAWMNPRDPEATIEHTAEPCLRALAEGIRQRRRT